MKTIYFARHGETTSNFAKLVSGSGSDVPLTDNGRRQAKKTGMDLNGYGIALILCSPLQRAIETTEIIAQEIGYSPKDIIKEPLFTERDYGIYEGKSEKSWFEAIVNNSLHQSVETTQHMRERLTKALESLHTYGADKILLVSHGSVSRALRAIHQNLYQTKMYDLDKLANAEIYEFTI